MNNKTKTLVTISMFCAVTYVVMVIGRVPVIMFLKYDPSDVIVTLGGLILGPTAAFIIKLIEAPIEMITVSGEGIIGCIMNIIQTAVFACTAALIYKKKHTLAGAIIGLLSGWFAMVVVMLLWNYLITPIYLGTPRTQIAAMLPTVFLPFNLLKGGLNAAITFLLYKPVITALRKSGFISVSQKKTSSKYWWLLVIAGMIIITCILIILTLNGTI